MTLDSTPPEESSEETASTAFGTFYKVGLVVVASFIVWASTLLMGAGSVDEQTSAVDDGQSSSKTQGQSVSASADKETVSSHPSGDPLVVDGGLSDNGKTVDQVETDGVIATGDAVLVSDAKASNTLKPSDTAQPSSPVDASETPAASAASKSGPAVGSGDGASNLQMILSSSARNTNHDSSPYVNTPSAQLKLADHYGPRSDYLASPAQNGERAYPVTAGGQFRAGCEFSHFSYDDPLIFPNQPGASHLHMHFGNTQVNAFTTFDSLLNSGSSTCNGQELNRTGYWVPAMFDGNGNVRIPERIVVYYKGEGLARGNSEIYPDGAALIAGKNLNTTPESQGGATKMTYVCSDNYSINSGVGSQTMPGCDGSMFTGGVHRTVLEMNVKFPQCWNGKNPGDYNNYRTPNGSWYGSNCTGEFNRTLPNLEYFVNYKVDPGENTSKWFLSSDVDASTFGSNKKTGGSTIHADWWGGWNKEVAQMWIKNCVNYRSSVASGCGFGYLTDGGPNGGAPFDGPALKMRPQYTGPNKVAASTVFAELCPNSGRKFLRPEDAAYCNPA